ncbi:MAG: hypothetical protein KAS72_12075 [Phycisphaerales bacterium]|nr:hypothetical protein [Phycisphaerales bacterium]
MVIISIPVFLIIAPAVLRLNPPRPFTWANRTGDDRLWRMPGRPGPREAVISPYAPDSGEVQPGGPIEVIGPCKSLQPHRSLLVPQGLAGR